MPSTQPRPRSPTLSSPSGRVCVQSGQTPGAACLRPRRPAANRSRDMQYVSTRGSAPALDFEGVTLAGLASDGGLYLPREWPHFSARRRSPPWPACPTRSWR